MKKHAWNEFDDKVREELAPEIVIVRLLGRGSVASVYLGRESDLDRQVAVKVLSPKYALDETTRRRFEREARSAARITHPNVTAVYRVGRLSDGTPFLVMEYVDGRNIEDHSAAVGELPLEDAKEILRQLAAGMAAAHAQQIVHRDVKPANVLRESRTGRILLTDFGLAAAKDRVDETTRLTMHGQVLGDLPFVSPEHLSGDELTELADVYAFGVIGYHLLTGQGPYGVVSAADLTSAHLRDPPIPLTELRADADPKLAQLLARCLAKRPEQRPSATDIVHELATTGDTTPVPDSLLGQFLAEMKRRHVYKVGAAYAALAIALIGVTEGVQEPLQLSDAAYRSIIGAVLAGFPVTLALSWMFDLRAGRIERTEDGAQGGLKGRVVPAVALVLSLAVAALIWQWVVGRG